MLEESRIFLNRTGAKDEEQEKIMQNKIVRDGFAREMKC